MNTTPKRFVLVTGGTTGVGRAIATYLHDSGYSVIATFKRNIQPDVDHKYGMHLLQLDLTIPASIEMLNRDVDAIVGTNRLVALVNNAGIAVGGPLEAIPIELFRQPFEVNVAGPLAVTQRMLPILRKSSGKIINISSISGRLSSPFFGPYAASKFALDALTTALRLELMPEGMHVVLITLGNVKTPVWSKSVDALNHLESQSNHEIKLRYGAKFASICRLLTRSEQRAMEPNCVAQRISSLEFANSRHCSELSASI